MDTLRQVSLFNLVLLVLCLSIPASLVENTYLQRFNWIYYDMVHGLMGQQPSDEVVIVAIDEKSLKALGRWPWSRHVHANLLHKINPLMPKAVGFDILFPETETLEADTALADAIEASGRVVLAMAPEVDSQGIITSELLPEAKLAASAYALGHVDFELSVDGICRSVYLYAGLGNSHWQAFALALYSTATQKTLQSGFPGIQGDHWVRHKLAYIPFLKDDRPLQVSYIDVLQGKVDDQLRHKIVLIGATAEGLGDQLATPVSGGRQMMPGVEMNAQLLTALLNQRFFTHANYRTQFIYGVLLTALFCGLLYFFRRTHHLILLMVFALAQMLLSFVILRFFQYWLPPFVGLVAASIVYVIVSWRVHLKVKQEIRQLNQDLSYQAEYDAVSMLPNRKALEAQLQQQLKAAKASGYLVGVYVINLGETRLINDQLGFKVVDELLMRAADRIRLVLGQNTLLAKVNGEFTVVDSAQTELRIKHIGGRLLQMLQKPFHWEGQDYYLPPSIGISVFPEDGLSSESLINNAFTAMHRARLDQNRGLLFFSKKMKQDLVQQSALENDLRKALLRQELVVYYQPQIDAESGQVVGAEALLRWRHQVRGMVPPDEFIPLAEKLGLINKVGEWVLDQACIAAKAWSGRYIHPLRVAVNVSAYQLSESFVERVSRVLIKTQLPAECLELEVTETALMSNLDVTCHVLNQIKALGVKIAVDDFGTGYSSLNYLKMFPVDRLKIDRTFTQDIGQQTSCEDITVSIIAMAHRLGLEVVAEGVETHAQAAFLKAQSCQLLQGYLYGKPMPLDAFHRFLSDSSVSDEFS